MHIEEWLMLMMFLFLFFFFLFLNLFIIIRRNVMFTKCPICFNQRFLQTVIFTFFFFHNYFLFSKNCLLLFYSEDIPSTLLLEIVSICETLKGLSIQCVYQAFTSFTNRARSLSYHCKIMHITASSFKINLDTLISA